MNRFINLFELNQELKKNKLQEKFKILMKPLSVEEGMAVYEFADKLDKSIVEQLDKKQFLNVSNTYLSVAAELPHVTSNGKDFKSKMVADTITNNLLATTTFNEVIECLLEHRYVEAGWAAMAISQIFHSIDNGIIVVKIVLKSE